MGPISKAGYVLRTRGLSQMLSAVLRELMHIVYAKGFKRRFVKRQIFNWRMYLDLDDRGISRALWLFGRRELDHKWIIETVLHEGDVVLDVGANIGYYALMELECIGERGKVIAIEPSPDNLILLKRNLALNECRNCEVAEGAVSRAGGRSRFWLAQHSNLNSFHKDFLDESGQVKEEIEVEVYAISELLDAHQRVDLVRMDIEGHEIEVLGGICDFVKAGKQRPPNIIFETHTRSYSAERNIEKTIRELASSGYNVKYVASSSEKGTRILESMSLPTIKRIRTDDVVRTIHRDVPLEALIHCLTVSGGIRTVFLEHVTRY